MLGRLSRCLLLLLPGAPLLAQSCTKPVPAVDSSAAFWRQQLRFPRVQAARAAAGPVVAARLRARSLDPDRLEIMIRYLKTHHELEIWARNRGGSPFELPHAYPLSATSGTRGPKRRAGNGQVPGGFYGIDRFLNLKYHSHARLVFNARAGLGQLPHHLRTVALNCC